MIAKTSFGEVSKYARVRHPGITGMNDRTRIKQVYRVSGAPLDFWFPPKWKVNHRLPSPFDG